MRAREAKHVASAKLIFRAQLVSWLARIFARTVMEVKIEKLFYHFGSGHHAVVEYMRVGKRWSGETVTCSEGSCFPFSCMRYRLQIVYMSP